jgi:segregation and condensation protein A
MEDAALVRMDVFEGPVELLLYLVRKNELNVLDIPIARLTDDYLAYLRTSPALNLDTAADFMVMAAVLVRLKVRALLPRMAEEDLTTPQVTLEQILDSYRQFQNAAQILARREAQQRLRFPRKGESPRAKPAEQEELALLTQAFSRLLARLKPQPQLTIAPREYKIEDKIQSLRLLINKRMVVDFEEAINGATLTELIVTFLALLELVRLGEVTVEQQEEFGPIRLSRREGANASA